MKTAKKISPRRLTDMVRKRIGGGVKDKPGDAQKRVKPPLIWLETNTCAGDILSVLNIANPTFPELVEDLFDLRHTISLMFGDGSQTIEILEAAAAGDIKDYYLVVEGTVPTADNGIYCVIGQKDGKNLTALEAVQKLGPGAQYVIAVGSCASWGLPFGAYPNPTGSKPVSAVLNRKVINVPGCPVNPEWAVGTLCHLLWFGEPELDSLNRPTMFYGETIHNLCTRRHYYESGIFAEKIGEPWCMYKIGCKGPVTYADCPSRQWNGEHVNWPVGANTPCIGCASPEFLERTSPFFKHLPDLQLPNVRVATDRVALATGVVTALGIGAHLAEQIATGRLQKTLKKGFSGTFRIKNRIKRRS